MSGGWYPGHEPRGPIMGPSHCRPALLISIQCRDIRASSSIIAVSLMRTPIGITEREMTRLVGARAVPLCYFVKQNRSVFVPIAPPPINTVVSLKSLLLPSTILHTVILFYSYFFLSLIWLVKWCIKMRHRIIISNVLVYYWKKLFFHMFSVFTYISKQCKCFILI